MSSFGWLLDLLTAESATPAPEGVAAGVAKSADAGGRVETSVDEVPHLPHLPHQETQKPTSASFCTSTRASAREDDLLENLAERAAVLEFDGGLERAEADVAAVRIVQCSTCKHWTPDPLGGGGIGTCATGADSRSWSALDFRPLSAWPDGPRCCAEWAAATNG